MTKRRPRIRLSVQLALCALGTFVLAAGVFMLCYSLGTYIIENRVYTVDKVQQAEKEQFDEFISYMNENGITSFTDSERIQPFFEGRSQLIISVYNAGLPFADSLSSALIYSSLADAEATYVLLQRQYEEYWYTCPVTVRGDYLRTMVVRVMYFPMYAANRYLMYFSAILAFGAFAAGFMLLVRRKTRYISTLAEQITVMAGGELTQSVTVKGGDELTTLAENMDAMRLSFIERLEHEEEMARSSSQLLTDMSHDLRTPLTALIGYLDIIDSGKCQDEEQKAKYVSSAKKRAYQIKEMTDELFEYFLVYSSQNEQPETERADAALLEAQLWSESEFTLESDGFTCQSQWGEHSGEVDVNIRLLRRVFDNIASNIRKYADADQPVTARFDRESDSYVARFANVVSSRPGTGESSGIGLASCEKIARLHGGEFTHATSSGRFECALSLPCVDKDEKESP